jgi:hypothetical protein
VGLLSALGGSELLVIRVLVVIKRPGGENILMGAISLHSNGEVVGVVVLAMVPCYAVGLSGLVVGSVSAAGANSMLIRPQLEHGAMQSLKLVDGLGWEGGPDFRGKESLRTPQQAHAVCIHGERNEVDLLRV